MPHSPHSDHCLTDREFNAQSPTCPGVGLNLRLGTSDAIDAGLGLAFENKAKQNNIKNQQEEKNNKQKPGQVSHYLI